VRLNALTRCVLLSLVLTFAGGLRSALAQAPPTPTAPPTQAPPTQKDQQPKPAGTALPGAPVIAGDDNPVPQPGPAIPNAGEIKDVGTGLPILGTSSTPLRWGDFSIGSFEYVGLYDSYGATATVPASDTNVSIFRTSLVFDRYVWKSRIYLQYLPQLAIYQGQVHANGGEDNRLTLGTKFELTPRLSLTVQDTFTQVKEKQLVPENYLASASYGGSVSQNSFLNNNGSFLSDTASATFNYAFTPRTSLIVAPLFAYSDSNDSQANYSATGETYQGTVGLSHSLTPHRVIGVTDSYQLLQDNSVSGLTTARYSVTGVFYSEQLAPNIWVSGNAGASHQDYSNQVNSNGWGTSGGASLVWNFSPISNAALAYTRGVSFSNYVTVQRSDRVDASMRLHIMSKLLWSFGAGYFREIGSNPNTNGRYGTTGLEYSFWGNFSLFGSFTAGSQNSSTPQLLSGTFRTATYGVRWRPPVVDKH
jgi:hypothetical protein